ncbi:MAG TPA: CARDB domain-containing protein [Reyranella sp.]|nr:CARDB domain-containing protein [Reyranella sp.]
MKAVIVASLVAMLVGLPSAQSQNLRPDLIVTGVTVDSSRIGVGETFDYVVTVKNIGGAPCNLVTIRLLPATGSTAAEMVSSRAEFPLDCTLALCQGGMPFMLWPGHAVWARYTMKGMTAGSQPPATVTVDPNNRCRESSERNNTAMSPAVQVIDRPKLKLTIRRPAPATIQLPTEWFPITIANVGRGVATDVAVSWPTGLGDLDPLLGPLTGPPFAPGTNAPATLPVTCSDQATPPGRMCVISVRLGPNEAIQGHVRFAACRNRRNVALSVSTADDTAVEDHSIPIHRGCSS